MTRLCHQSGTVRTAASGLAAATGDNTFQRSETTKLVVVDPSLVVRWKGRSFRFLSVYHHFVLRGTKIHFLSSRANVDYSLTLGLSQPHVQLAMVESINQIRPGADGCRFRFRKP